MDSTTNKRRKEEIDMYKIGRAKFKSGDVLHLDNNNIIVCDEAGDVYIYNLYNVPKAYKEQLYTLKNGTKFEIAAINFMTKICGYEETDPEAWNEWED